MYPSHLSHTQIVPVTLIEKHPFENTLVTEHRDLEARGLEYRGIGQFQGWNAATWLSSIPHNLAHLLSFVASFHMSKWATPLLYYCNSIALKAMSFGDQESRSL
jgi:hypothetical protein